MSTRPSCTLDPVTFEVLKNAFVTSVDLMAEQILRTCHSFVIYARDFSSRAVRRQGNTVMQGRQDIAVHVGTLHFTCKAVIEAFARRHPPGRRLRRQRPLPRRHALQRRAHHPARSSTRARSSPTPSPTGTGPTSAASVPGSFDINAKEHFGEGLRIPPVRHLGPGRATAHDVGRLIFSNTRAPSDAEGDLHAQAEATRVCEREILRLVDKYGADTVVTAFDEVQDYVERLTRAAHRGAARRRLGDRGLPRLRPRPRRGPGPDPRQDDDRRATSSTTT